MRLRNIGNLTIEQAGNEGAAGAGSPPPIQGGGENNSGQPPAFDASKFWTAAETPLSTPPANPAPTTQTQQEPPSPIAGIVGAIKDARFASGGFMTPDVVNGMGDNNFAPFNEGLTAFGRDVLTQSAQTTTAMLGQVIPALLQHVTQMIESNFGAKDTTAFLESKIASAKDPALAPVVRNIFDVAMKATKGDKEAAVAMTRTMLQTVGTGIAREVDLTIPAPNNSNAAPVDWMKELGALGSLMERK